MDIGRTPPLIVAGDAASTRLELWQAHLKLGAKGSATGAYEVEIEAAIDKMRLVLDVGEGDGFLQKVLGDNPQTVELNPGFAWSNTRGFRFMGELRLEIEIWCTSTSAGSSSSTRSTSRSALGRAAKWRPSWR